MTLIRQLRDDAIDSGKSLSDVLRRATVLASLLRNNDLRTWAKHELDGYPSDATLPEYRRVPVEIYGHCAGPFGRQMSNYRIPVHSLGLEPHLLRHLGREIRLRNGVPSIEEMIASGDSNLKFSIANEVSVALPEIVSGCDCVALWRQTHKSALKQVLDSVRNRLLEIALELAERFPEINESESAIGRVDHTAAAAIIHNHIYGNSNIVASGTSFTQSVQHAVNSGNVDALVTYVRSVGVAPDDSAELLAAVEEDGPQSSRKFGPRVAAWFGRTSQKLLEAGFNAAPALLTEAISRYYGWK